MSELLAWMEGSWLATWTRESPSLLAYPSILALHSVGLGIVVGASVVVDLRLLGYARRIPIASLRGLFPVVWWAFALNATTGLVLFMADATARSTQPVFMVKLACIAAALLVTARLRASLSRPPRADTVTTTRERTLAVASLVLWSGAIVAGRLMAYM